MYLHKLYICISLHKCSGTLILEQIMKATFPLKHRITVNVIYKCKLIRMFRGGNSNIYSCFATPTRFF